MKYQDDTDPGTSEVRDTAVEEGVGGGGHMTEVKIHSV